MKRFFLIILILVPLHATATPTDSINKFQQALIEFALTNNASFENRYQQLEPIVEATHDLNYIAKLTIGRYWSDLTPKEQQTFSSRFRQLAIANYAARFPQFSGEQFTIVEEKPQRRGIVLVRTELQRPDSTPLSFDYMLHETPEGWRIVNILVNGVSDLALKRAEYSALLRDGSMQELIKTLDDQIERLHTVPQSSQSQMSPK